MARRNSRSSAPRRRMFWARTVRTDIWDPAIDPLAKAGTPIDLLGDFKQEYGANLFGFTVTRIRGELCWTADTTTVTVRQVADAGIRVADEQAVISQNSELERQNMLPTFDQHADWMWTHTTEQLSRVSTQGNGGWDVLRVPVDIKSQRRIDELGQSLFLIYGQSDITGTGQLEEVRRVLVNLSVLCKRP